MARFPSQLVHHTDRLGGRIVSQLDTASCAISNRINIRIFRLTVRVGQDAAVKLHAAELQPFDLTGSAPHADDHQIGGNRVFLFFLAIDHVYTLLLLNQFLHTGTGSDFHTAASQCQSDILAHIRRKWR